MKNYALYEDLSYDSKKRLHKLDKDGVSMYLLSIETPLKGPIYTIVKKPEIHVENMDIDVTINMTYDQEDVPFSEDAVVSSTFSINSSSNYYNIYPLIKQMFAFNTYNEMQSLNSGESLFISSVDINCPKTHVHLDESASYKEIMKTFKKLNMLTMTTNVLEYPGNELLEYPRCIILKNGRWKICKLDDTIKEKFDEIFIPITSTETLYKLSYDEFALFCNIRYADIEIALYPTNDIDGSIEPATSSFLDLINHCNKNTDPKNTYDLLSGCLFIPQLLLLMTRLWDYQFELTINCGVLDRTLMLSYHSKSMNANFSSVSIFDLFKRLLDIEL